MFSEALYFQLQSRDFEPQSSLILEVEGVKHFIFSLLNLLQSHNLEEF